MSLCSHLAVINYHEMWIWAANVGKTFRKVMWHAVLCFENRGKFNFRSRSLVLMEWWVTFELRNRSSVPQMNGLTTVSTMKETKWKYFVLPSTKWVCLAPYFTCILVTDYSKYFKIGRNICSTTEMEELWKGKVLFVLFWKFDFEIL
jgi:hypothetical protein